VPYRSCTAVDVVGILRKKRQTLTHLEIVADGEQAAEPPWAFRRIHLTYRLRGTHLTSEAVARAIELSEGRYCSVSASLRPQVEITTSFEILPGDCPAERDEVESNTETVGGTVR
jgi:putative redox protein